MSLQAVYCYDNVTHLWSSELEIKVPLSWSIFTSLFFLKPKHSKRIKIWAHFKAQTLTQKCNIHFVVASWASPSKVSECVCLPCALLCIIIKAQVRCRETSPFIKWDTSKHQTLVSVWGLNLYSSLLCLFANHGWKYDVSSQKTNQQPGNSAGTVQSSRYDDVMRNVVSCYV